MTNAEIIERQRLLRQFGETELGQAFTRWENAYSRAWVKDTESGYRDGISNSKSLDEAWKKENDARLILMPMLYKLAGVLPSETSTV